MERARKKKLRNLRILATNIFMGLSIVSLAGVITLLAMGFRLSKDGGLEQSGLVQIKSNPNGATVEINGVTQFYRTEMNKMLSDGSHEIVVTKSGYDTWSTTVDIERGLLTRIDWVRLFPLKRTIEDVRAFKPLRLVSASPDKYYLALLPEESTQLQLIDVHLDDVKYTNLDLALVLGITPPGPSAVIAPTGQLSVTQWSANHNKFLLKWAHDSIAEWILIDIATPANSINLTKAFAMNFANLQIADAAATKIWATENRNLRLIHTDSTTISNVLIPHVEEFVADTTTISFIGIDAESRHVIGIYKEGEKGTTTIQEITDDVSAYRIAIGSNWKDEWVAYSLDNRLFVRIGNHPSYQGGTKLRTIIENDLEFTPTLLTPSPTGRFLIASTAEQVTSIDIEIEKRFDYDFPGSTINWLDDFLLWTDQDDKLSIIDFNGENRRELADITSGFDLALTTNNRWIYFIVSQEDEATKTTSFTLKRERL